MPRWDFWNNPLVVSAFRVKYRRGTPTMMAAVYLVALVMLGSALHYYRFSMGPEWLMVYFVAVMAIQFAVSILISVVTTSSGMQAEVVNRTLDGQRIAALSQTEIVLGKLLGESAVGYFMMLTTVPIVVMCWALGVVSPLVIVLLYVQLITISLLAGSIGLIQPLELPSGRSGALPRRLGHGAGVALLALLAAPSAAMNAGSLANSPLASVVFGAFTPILSLHGIATGEAWRHGMDWYGLRVSFLLLAPLAQLAVAGLCFGVVARALRWPRLPALSKSRAYVVLAVVDLVTAGVLFHWGPPGGSLVALVARYWIAHLAAAFVLLFTATPAKEVIVSWAWRFRGRTGYLRDQLFGDRSDNRGMLLMFCVLGLVNLVVFVLLPQLGRGGGAPIQAAAGSLILVCFLTLLLILALGAFYQWCVLIASRPGRVAFVLAAGCLMLAPVLLALRWDIASLRALSPVLQYARYLREPFDPLPWGPLAATYGIILAFAWWSVGRRVGQHVCRVDGKLRAMGVAPLTRLRK
jgi:hypothetical protein